MPGVSGTNSQLLFYFDACSSLCIAFNQEGYYNASIKCLGLEIEGNVLTMACFGFGLNIPRCARLTIRCSIKEG